MGKKDLDQRYVSKELTHFVGSKLLKDKEKQYLTLIKILKEGWLTASGNEPKDSTPRLMVDFGVKLSENKMYNPSMVCFCDIPIRDLIIHIKKYGCFGISFLKSFLVKQGANPVYYISKNAKVKTLFERKKITISKYFDEIKNEHLQIFSAAWSYLPDKFPKLTEERIHKYHDFLNFFIFSFLKFFNENKSDDDTENYYMEREWRTLTNIRFNIKDVYRIILPESYSERFRKDFPNYYGQISFVE